MRYLLLLRGINVGGKNKVSMATLKQQLQNLGTSEVSSYINSGNLFFTSEDQTIKNQIEDLFKNHYSFHIPFTLLGQGELNQMIKDEPHWWSKDLARKDVLFYTDKVNQKDVETMIKSLPLNNDFVHLTSHGIFWGHQTESEFLKSTYHKELIKQPFYKFITIRNGNTYEKIKSLV